MSFKQGTTAGLIIGAIAIPFVGVILFVILCLLCLVS